MKTILRLIISMILISCTVTAQTNVSGGIYSNAVWTLSNSPYIVTDDIVVFPGVTLTIEPGVIVKFEDGKYLEIRQGTLIAAGTAADSITITSNSPAPIKGIFKGINFTNAVSVTIDYCIFKYADYALKYTTIHSDSIVIQHSYFSEINYCITSTYAPIYISQTSFYNNENCIPGGNYSIYVLNSEFYNNTNCVGQYTGNIKACYLNNCNFTNNHFGVDFSDRGTATNCTFNNNELAVFFDDETKSSVYNCTFCSNTQGIFMHAHQSNDTIVNCNFSQNHIAIQSFVPVDYISGNILTDNDTALMNVIGSADSVFNNFIFHNQVGLIFEGGASAKFYNNYICNNTLYNIIYTSSLNDTLPPVCFCNVDSSAIRSKIYDGYVDITRGLLSFNPVNCDSSALSSIHISCPNINTGIPSIEFQGESIVIFPNPAANNFTINNIPPGKNVLMQIINLLGETVYRTSLTGNTYYIVNINFPQGIYLVQINDGERNTIRKLVIE